MFAQCFRTMENIPPTKAVLLQHVRRAAYDHRRLSWSPSCLVLHFGGGSHLIWDGNPFGLNYQRSPLHATNVYTADAGCRRQCKCRSSNLQCTELCKCSGACGDNVQTLKVCCHFLVHSSSHSVSLSLFLVCLYMTHIMTMLLCRLYWYAHRRSKSI